MNKPKLELETLTDQQTVDLATLIATQLTGNAAFSTPNPTIAALTTMRNDVATLLSERANLLAEAQAKTLAIRAALDTLRAGLTQEASYVETVANGDATLIASAGMQIADTPAAVGEMPQVELLQTTQGDEAGEVDLQWQPIRRGLKSYVIEKSASPDGQSAWVHAQVETRSRASVKGLTSGTRYWFRVAGVGAAGQGPWSDIQTKVAP
jgi:hypothetical protein